MTDKVGRQVNRLAAQLAAGSITHDEIRETFGDGILSSVLAVAGGGVGGIAAGVAYDVAKETPVVGDIVDVAEEVTGSVVKTIFGMFG